MNKAEREVQLILRRLHHAEDIGIRHANTKRSTQQLKGKVERYHRCDEQEYFSFSATKVMATSK